LQVIDPVKASYNVENYEEAMINLAQTTMRSEIGKLTLDETFEKRDEINQKVVETIAKEANDWGITLLRYEVRDIEPPNQILTSMTLQAEAERSKRAQILDSEGTRQADINIAQAKRQAQILEAEGHQEKQVIVAKAQG
jgi:regulator of protease activity HflC (stomatin/prohibitin superfamily)